MHERIEWPARYVKGGGAQNGKVCEPCCSACGSINNDGKLSSDEKLVNMKESMNIAAFMNIAEAKFGGSEGELSEEQKRNAPATQTKTTES